MHNFNIIYHRVTSILFHDHKWVTDGNFLKIFSVTFPWKMFTKGRIRNWHPRTTPRLKLIVGRQRVYPGRLMEISSRDVCYVCKNCGAIEGGRYFSLYLNNFPRGIRFESKVTSLYFIALRFSNFSLKLFGKRGWKFSSIPRRELMIVPLDNCWMLF